MLEEAKAQQAKAALKPGQKAQRTADSAVWRTIRREAEREAESEPLLSSFLYACILSHDSFERSLAFVLSNRLSDATLLPTELFEVFHSVLKENSGIVDAAMADLCAVRERVCFIKLPFYMRSADAIFCFQKQKYTRCMRYSQDPQVLFRNHVQDPACASYSQALLYFKGFHAIQCQRIAHSLWLAGRRVLATALQSRASEVFAVDIHPAAKIGKGVLLDHGTGVVIGETAEVGNNVSILQNVTLGGTGKETGDRHPKVSDNVLIGASATILGNIRIGKGAQVAAGSLVLKPVPPRTMVAGSPAKEVGKISGNPAFNMEHWTDRSTDRCDDLFAVSSSGLVVATAQNAVANAAPTEGVDRRDIEAEPVPSEAPVQPPIALPAETEKTEKTPPLGGSPPKVNEAVEAVRTDAAAKKKWGGRKVRDDDVEYVI
jgi:serine O-acetyltransferase